MQIKGAADESNRGHAKAVLIHSRPGGGNDVRVIGQAQVVVGAQVHHRALLGVLTDLDFTPLGRNNQTFTLPQPLRSDLVKGGGHAAIKLISAHSSSFAHSETTAGDVACRYDQAGALRRCWDFRASERVDTIRSSPAR